MVRPMARGFTLLEMIVSVALTGVVVLAVIAWVSALSGVTNTTLGTGAVERDAAAFDTRIRLDAGSGTACQQSGRRVNLVAISQTQVAFIIADTDGDARNDVAHWQLAPSGETLTSADGATTAGARWLRSVAVSDPTAPDNDCQWAVPGPTDTEAVTSRVRDTATIAAFDRDNNPIVLPVGDGGDPAWHCIDPGDVTDCAQVTRLVIENTHVAGNGTPILHRTTIDLPAGHL